MLIIFIVGLAILAGILSFIPGLNILGWITFAIIVPLGAWCWYQEKKSHT